MKKLICAMTIAAVTGAVTAQPKQAEEAKPAAATGPLEAPAAGADHFFRAGLLATTTYYQDQVLKQGLVNGNYRPFANYAYNEKYSFMVRGNLALKYYPEKPASVERQVNAVGILEITSFEGNFGRHSVTAGRSFY